MKKRILTIFASLVIALSLSAGASFTKESVSYSAQAASCPTQEQIRQRYNQLAVNTSTATSFTSEYSTTAPYAMGDISAKDRQNALNAVNLCRYIAGLPDDIGLVDEYNQYAQAASLVNAANGSLSHHPAQPSGMADDLYAMGAAGAGSSNIAMGYTNLADSVIRGYMQDSDAGNIDRLGHRRWLLSPSLQYLGFGQVGRYSATYVMGEKRSTAANADYVAWPPANMPMELYYPVSGQYAFSVTLGSAYDTPSLSNVTVEVYSKKQNKTWNLNSSSTSYTNFLTVENSWYGDPKCIIFNVGEFTAGDTVSVKIDGITKGGAASPISYDVNFFEINGAAHNHLYKLTSTKPATCTTEGLLTYTCDECGDSYTETIPKTAHSFSSEWTIDKMPTCTEEGSQSNHCTICGEKSGIVAIPKTDHIFTSKITLEPTCAAEGVNTLTCARCGETKTEPIPKTEHTYSEEWTIDKQPTCSEAGSKSHHCTVCGEKGDITAIPKTEHTFTEKVTKEATCASAGVITKTCTVCGETETEGIPAKEHSFGEYKVTKEATEDKDGEEARTCAVCGKTETRAIPKLNAPSSTSSSSSSSNSSSSTSEPTSSTESGNPTESGSPDNSSNGTPDSNGANGSANSSSTADGSSGTVSPNESGTSGADNSTGNFFKDNLVVILLAGVSCIAAIVLIVLGVIASKKRK